MHTDLPSLPSIRRIRTSGLALVLACTWMSPARPAAAELLWQMGRPDNDDREFAFAPHRYGEARTDGFFVVGRSDAKVDWPYAHPGPSDAWGGGRSHTFTILFGLNTLPQPGECRLTFDFVDTHGGAPPTVRVTLNGREFRQLLPRGGGDASIFGDPAKGKEHRWTIPFPSTALRTGANTVEITTLEGSWLLYDWIGLETPAGGALGEVHGTVLSSPRSAPVLIERAGRLLQTIEVEVRHLDEPKSALIRVGEGAPQSFPLRAGAQTLEVTVPAVAQETNVAVRLEVAGQTLAPQTLTLKPVRQWVVYLLPHSHVDIGYTHVQTDVERAQWKYLEMAIDTARRTAQHPPGSRFKWNVEVLWAVDSYLRQASPEKQQAFLDAVKTGQVGLQALYGNELTGLCRPEELLRLVGFAQRLAQRVGQPIESAMITDVPGYTWGMVPTFAHSGVKYFSIGPNGGDRIGRTIAAWGDKPFWWIGPNAQDKVLVWMTGTGYYQVFQSPQKLLDYLGQLEAKNYPYDFVQVRHCLGDNGAPDVEFADKVKAWNETHAYPRLVIATSEEMFRDFEQRYGDRLPTARGDFTPYWEDGAASSALETAMNRASADRLTQAEALFALFNPRAYPAEKFLQAWRNVLLYDEHTWGAHNSISEPDAPFVKQQWAIKRQFAVDADAASRALLVAADAARGVPPAPANALPGAAIDVINTTAMSMPYTLVVVPRELAAVGNAVCGGPTNAPSVLSQRLSSGELIFRPCWEAYRAHRYFVTGEPPAKAATNFPAARAEGLTLTTARSALGPGLTLRVDGRTGAIVSLTHDGRELVDSNAPTALNDYFYLPGADLQGLQRNGAVSVSVKERGPLVASLLVESPAPGCRRLTREIRVHALRNYVEIVNTLDKAPVRTKEGVHFGFGFHVPEGVVRMDVPWGVVRPELDQIPGACKNWFTVQRWVDVSNDKYGVTLVTPDAPLVEVGGITANLIGSQTDPKAWIEHLEPSQTIYSWVMNNHWHTNYRAEQEGPTVFRFYLVPHAGGFNAAEASRVSLELSQPLLALPARGTLPTAPMLSVQSVAGPASFQVSALKPSDDGAGWIVRLFNAAAEAGQAQLAWAGSPPPKSWLSDTSERPLQEVTGPISLPGWGIATIRLDRP